MTTEENASDETEKSKRGRPAIFDDFKQQQLVSLVTAGCSIALAARYLGLNRRTITYALKHNPDLKLRVDQARVACELVPLGQIRTAGRETWRAGAWYLERVRPRRYRGGKSKRLGVEQAVRLINRLIDSITAEVEDDALCRKITAIGRQARRWIRCDVGGGKTDQASQASPLLPIEEIIGRLG